MLELYLTSLLIDGRDAPRWHDRNAPFVVLAQPLKAELLPDRIELTVSNQSLKLPSLGSEGAKLGLTIRVQSERPPPYPVVLEMSWDTDLNVVRQDSGPAIRSGRNELRLDRELTEMEFRVSPRRESRDDSRASVRAQARFASASPAAAEATCLLPRPDQVELAIAADNDLNGSRRRIWFPHA